VKRREYGTFRPPSVSKIHIHDGFFITLAPRLLSIEATMRYIKLVIPAFVLGAGLLITSSMSFAKPEDTKATKKACGFCHVTPKGGKDLTEAGKYYKENKSLEGFKAKK
jgi:hypothetical protein